MKPLLPKSPNFATGPVKKILNWNVDKKYADLLGRSHRGAEFIDFTDHLMAKIRSLLNIPLEFKVFIAPGSATGACELVFWNLLGVKPVDCLAWEVFGNIWYNDIINELKLKNVRLFHADFGEYPDTKAVDFANNDVIFTHSGSTSGVIFNEEARIPLNREGLIFSDATSYALFYDIDWSKIDVLTFSFQKVLAGEAQHGVVVLSPRAVKRLREYTPSWPIPRLFSLKNDNILNDAIIDKYSYLNTPSALCLIDAMENIEFIDNHGGVNFVRKRVDANNEILSSWVNRTAWVEYLVANKDIRSKVIMCLKFVDKALDKLNLNERTEAVKFFHSFLAKNKAAFDIAMHRHAPLGIRVWLGYSIDPADVELLTKWLDLAFLEMKRRYLS